MPESLTAPLLFAGPSAWGLPPEVFAQAGVRLLPPVRRGDVPRHAAASERPGVMIVCDGVFQVAPAVSHQELCEVMDAGCQVWGVSSLGAIRAHELRAEGMHGFGEVFEMFARFEDFTDDEMCLLHCPEPPYFPLTEPLVNLRHALDRQGEALGLAPSAAQAVIEVLSALWFGDRTPGRILAALLKEGRMAAPAAEQLMGWLSSHRLKTLDLARLLATRPWQASPALALTP